MSIGVVILKINIISSVKNQREIYSEFYHIYIDPIRVIRNIYIYHIIVYIPAL